MEIEAGARKHGVLDEDILHALRNSMAAFDTGDPAVTMYIGPSRDAQILEVGVVVDDEGVAVIHAMVARSKFVEGMRSG